MNNLNILYAGEYNMHKLRHMTLTAEKIIMVTDGSITVPLAR